MDQDDQIAAIEEHVRRRERAIRRRYRLDKLWRRIRPVAQILLAVLLAGAGVLVVRQLMGRGGHPEPAAGTVSGGPPATSGGPPATSGGPFAGTPAANYPKGAAGITLPPAKAVPGFSAKQVADDLARVRAALIAGRLDPRMIERHDPEAFVKLLAPTSQADLKKDLGTRNGSTRVTWIDPRTPLDPREQPRVSGRMSFAATVQQGIPMLTVTSNFIWVYAFERGDRPVAAEHDEIVWTFSDSPRLRPADRGMFITSSTSYGALVDCAAADRGLLAPTPLADGRAPDPAETEDPKRLLNADHSIDIHDNC